MTKSFCPTIPILGILTSLGALTQASETSLPSSSPTSTNNVCLLSSARPSVTNGWNLFTQADWLYWKTNETGLGYALNQQHFDVTDPVLMGFGEVANPKFDWQSGFRVGVGYNIPHDQWDLTLLWTWNEGKGTDEQNSTDDDLPTILPIFVHPNIYNDESIAACNKAQYNALIHLNVLDLDLGKEFKASKWLSLKPHFGLRSAWIHQIHNVSYNDLFAKSGDLVLGEYLTHITNNFWGIGVRGGLGSDFGLKWGFSLVGDFCLSLLYGVFETSYSERFTTLGGIDGTTIAEDNSFHAGRVVTDIDLGLRWNRSFAKDRVRLLLQAGWEHHMFFSQNQIMHFVDGQSWGNFVQNQGDLYFQGWTASFRFFF